MKKRFEVYCWDDWELTVSDSKPLVMGVSGYISENLTDIARELCERVFKKERKIIHISDVLEILEKYNLLYLEDPKDILARREKEQKEFEYGFKKMKEALYKDEANFKRKYDK